MLPSIALSHKQLVCQRPLPSPPSCLRPASSQTASSRPRLVQQAVVTQQHCEATTSTSSSSTRSSQGWTLPEPLHSSLDLQTSSTRSPQVDIGRGPSSSGRGTGGRLGGPDGNGEDEFAVNFGGEVVDVCTDGGACLQKRRSGATVSVADDADRCREMHACITKTLAVSGS